MGRGRTERKRKRKRQGKRERERMGGTEGNYLLMTHSSLPKPAPAQHWWPVCPCARARSSATAASWRHWKATRTGITNRVAKRGDRTGTHYSRTPSIRREHLL